MAKRKCKSWKRTRAGRRCAKYSTTSRSSLRDAAEPVEVHIKNAERAAKDALRNLNRCSATSALPYAGCKQARIELRRALKEVDQVERHARRGKRRKR